MGRLLGATLAAPALFLATLSGCNFGSEATFKGESALSPCESAIPVCNTTAGCRLVEEDSHIEGAFPGFRQFIVPTTREAWIRVKIYWRTQLSPGADTEIIWHEPACVDDYRYESQGVDIFEETGNDGVLIKEQQVFRGGDHLVEVRSDATGEYVLRTFVLTEEEYAAEQAGLFKGDNDPFAALGGE